MTFRHDHRIGVARRLYYLELEEELEDIPSALEYGDAVFLEHWRDRLDSRPPEALHLRLEELAEHGARYEPERILARGETKKNRRRRSSRSSPRSRPPSSGPPDSSALGTT